MWLSEVGNKRFGLLIVAQRSLLKLESTEPTQWKNSQDKTPKDAGGTDTDCYENFIDSQGLDLQNTAKCIDLDEENLNDDWNDNDNKEVSVKEHVREGVYFVGEKQSSIEEVEDLE